MKSSKLIFGVSALFLAGCLTFTSCKKKTETPADPAQDTDQSSANDNNSSESFASDIINIGSQASENGGTSLNTFKYINGSNNGGNDVLSSSCATITYSLSTKTFTVDFGSIPCMCSDGRYRSGKLMYNFSASTNSAVAYRMPGFSFNVTSSNYVVDGYTVNIISKTVSNTTPLTFNPSTTNLTWSISSNLQIIKPSSGGTVTWTCNRVTTLLNTSDTSVYKNQATPIKWLKAKIQINGSSSGTTAGGDTYTGSANNMVRDFGACAFGGRYPWISGSLDFKPGAKLNRHVDFGNGTCDNTATLTIGTWSTSFTL